MYRLLLCAAVISSALAATPARAVDDEDPDAGAPRRAAPSSEDDDYSFNWLDPDKKIYVLQNRRYRKGGHALLSGMVGTSLSNPYRSVTTFTPRLGFYFNEQFGIEGFVTIAANSENSMYRALVAAANNVLPVVREVKTQMGGMIHWAPWYSKINVFNSIIYFDWYFGLGLGMTASDVNYTRSSTGAYTRENDMTIMWATGHLFHVSDMFKIRFEFTGSHFKAPIFPPSLGGEEAWQNNYNVSLGVGIRL